MSSLDQQRVAATAEQIRAFIYRHCHEMSASEIADALGVHIRVVDIFYPRPSR
jgi:DNA-directed RNA polymerase specialized sigma24 family protein